MISFSDQACVGLVSSVVSDWR